MATRITKVPLLAPLGSILRLLAWGALLVIFVTTPVEAQERRPAKPRLEPWMRQQILDKGAIAQDAQRRLIGTREAGNPQLPAGSVLENTRLPLPDLDVQEARRRQLEALHSSRDIDWQRPEGAAVDEGSRTHRARPAPRAERPFPYGQVMAVAASVMALALVLRRAHRTAQPD